MNEKRTHDNKRERDEEIPAGVYEDINTIKNNMDEIQKLKEAKQYEQAAEKAKFILDKKVLPPTIKQQLLLESVDIYLEIGQYSEAQDLLGFVREMGSLSDEIADDIEYRILHIGIIKELLNKSNKSEVPWSTIPRLIHHQADLEMAKLLPSYKGKRNDINIVKNEVVATKEDGLARNKEIVASDKDHIKKDRFWIIVMMVIIIAAGTGFMLAMSYITWTSDSTNATLNSIKPSEQRSGDSNIDDGDIGPIIDPSSIVEDNGQMEYETITAEVFFSAGEWYFIQAGAYSNVDLANLNTEKFINANFYARQVSKDPTLLMVFAGTSQGQSENMLSMIKDHPDFENFSMYVRTIQAKTETMMVEGISIDKEALSLFGERMTGYLRLVSDTSLYMMEERDSDKRAEAVRELMNTTKQIRDQLAIILDKEENHKHRTLEFWNEELSYFVDRSQEVLDVDGFSMRLQEHVFQLLVPQIW